MEVLKRAAATPSAELFDKDDGQVIGNSGGTVKAPDLGDEMPGLVPATAQASSGPEITISLSTTIFKGDCLDHMHFKFDPDSFDHVVTDIPYGTDTDMQAQSSASDATRALIASVADTHKVEDNVKNFEPFLTGSYRVLRENGYLVFWCDIMHWEKLHTLAEKVGFKVQRWPLVWHKTHTCKNEAAQYNWTKNTEIAMVCRKGNPTLTVPQGSSVWAGSNEEVRALLQHPYAKPFDLWRWIYNAIAVKGQTVYDPYAGVGSAPIAAISSGYLPVCSELDEAHYNRLVINVANAYRGLAPAAKFN